MAQDQQYPYAGQQLGTTTLTAAVSTTTQSTIALTSVTLTVGQYTTITAKNPQWYLKIDGEIMAVTGVTGLNVSVVRGQFGTAATKHGNGQNVWAAPANLLPNVFAMYSNVPPQKLKYSNVPVGSVAYGSFGTDGVAVAGTLYITDVTVRENFLATGIGVLNGSTDGTDKGLVALYDFAGNLVASSAVAGATVSGTDAFQNRAFSAGPVFVPAGKYFIAYQLNGTTAKKRTVATNTFIDVLATSVTGTFGTVPASITVPTTFTADSGPVSYLY